VRLRTRLTLTLAVALVVGLALSSVLGWLLFVRQQRDQLHELVATDLQRLQRLMRDPIVGSDLLAGGSSALREQVVSRDGRVVLPLGDPAPLPSSEVPREILWQGRHLLVASAPWVTSAGRERGTIRLALDLAGARDARAWLARSLLISNGLIAVLALLSTLAYLRSSLRPLTDLAEKARRIDPADPRPTGHEWPSDEVGDLASALDAAFESIRQRKRAERASLAEVAHELAAPLTLVSQHLEALAEHVPYDAPQASRLATARDAARELLYTSQDLLTLSRGELERSYDVRLVDLRDIVERVAEAYPGVTTECRVEGRLAGTPDRLTQMVRNLVRNAVQSTAGPSDVHVLLDHADDKIVLEVHDAGAGIPEQDLPHVFDRFWTRRHGGSGLGLSVVRAVARQHGGDVTVESEAGEGSVFRVSLSRLETQFE
jgi:signal transduction histidine kinase